MSKSVYDGMNRLLVRHQACVPSTAGVPAGNVIETHWENDRRAAQKTARQTQRSVARKVSALRGNARINLGRSIRLLEGIAASSYVVHALACPPVPRTTKFAWHPSGQLERLILHNPDTGKQVTRWIFGTTLENSAIASNCPSPRSRPAGGEINKLTLHYDKITTENF